MSCEKFSLIGLKEVINIFDGRRLGLAIDLEIDVITGKVHSLIVGEEVGKWNFFCKGQIYVVPWRNICQIGDDIILVEVVTNDCLLED